jgi:hypothetical protein
MPPHWVSQGRIGRPSNITLPAISIPTSSYGPWPMASIPGRMELLHSFSEESAVETKWKVNFTRPTVLLLKWVSTWSAVQEMLLDNVNNSFTLSRSQCRGTCSKLTSLINTILPELLYTFSSSPITHHPRVRNQVQLTFPRSLLLYSLAHPTTIPLTDLEASPPESCRLPHPPLFSRTHPSTASASRSSVSILPTQPQSFS